jgi:hypothetical protein
MKYDPHGLGHPAVPLAISSAVRSSIHRTTPATFRRPGESSLRVPLSSRVLRSRVLAVPPQHDDSSPELSCPTAHSGFEGPLHAGVACPLRSAFRVWLPSWRFPPFEPGPVLFRTGSTPGLYPSELSPHQRCPLRFRRDGPTYRLSFRIYPPAEAGWPAPESRGFWVLALWVSPSRTHV